MKKSSNKDELIQLVYKMRKGRLCYDKFPRFELKRFAVDRGLVAADKNPIKRWLADMMMESDDERTFSKLPDMPPEIPKAIYKFYLSHFQPDTLIEPSQPPLARICQMTRNEVLLLFYSTCTFGIQFDTMSSSSPEHVRFRMTPMSYVFLNTLAPGCLGDLRKIDMLFEDKADVVRWDRCWVDIDLSPGARLCDVWSDEKMRKDGQRMKDKLRKVLRGISGRGQGKKLVLEDFNVLSSAVERAVKCKWVYE